MKTQPDLLVGLGELKSYAAFFNGKETVVKAQTSYLAYQLAVAFFKPAKSKRHMVHIHLMNERNEVVLHPNYF
jgi:hypothetical protein